MLLLTNNLYTFYAAGKLSLSDSGWCLSLTWHMLIDSSHVSEYTFWLIEVKFMLNFLSYFLFPLNFYLAIINIYNITSY